MRLSYCKDLGSKESTWGTEDSGETESQIQELGGGCAEEEAK